MKQLSTLILILFSSSFYAQTIGYNTITSNGMEVGLHADGTMFMDEEKSNAGYTVNSDENLSTIFSSSVWASGADLTGLGRASTSKYGGQGNDPAFVPGSYNESTFDFNKVWKVESSSIVALLNDFEDGTIDQQPDESILLWPGKGNPMLSDLPDGNFAPFFDQLGDGIYNPMEGDYPIINVESTNVIPSQMLYAVYNDSSIDSETRFGMEVHTILYSLECENQNIINKTIFASHRLVKKEVYSEPVYFGLWTDFDLGCIEDDAFGSIPELNAVFSYNIDPIDGDQDGNCQFNINSFNSNPGIQSLVILNHDISSVSSYVSSSASAPSGMYEPIIAIEKFILMGGRWKDGTFITEEGNGYNPGNDDITPFIFNGDITDSDQWSMASSNLPTYESFPIVNTYHKNLQIEQQVVVDCAYVFSQNEELDNLETYNEAYTDIEFVQDSYNEGFVNNCSFTLSTKENNISNFNISPNPVQDILYIDLSFDNYRIYDAVGRLVLKNGSSKNINVEALPDGIYTIILDKNNSKKVGRFIKI